MQQRIRRNKTGANIHGALLLCATAAGQQSDWKKKTIKDGEVSVRYRFTGHVDQKGKKYNMLGYEAVSWAKTDLERCKEVMMDDPKHMAFMEGTEGVKRVMNLSADEWVTYHFLNSRWPMPDSDLADRQLDSKRPGGHASRDH